MRASQFFISTQKEAPADAEVVSHKLMLRAGYVRRLAGGIVNWMPVGLRVVRKIENIIREEMNAAGAIELLMPVVQPAELWQESGRWEKYGPELLRIKDRHQRDFIIQPTSEEVITDIARNELKSYRQLPKNFYHIQTKFRDERRPRFGVMRGREFTMKDAYSFDRDKAGALRSYQIMYDAYQRIFDRIGLRFRAVAADTGAIGGDASHEFQVLADSGEDAIAYCPASEYAANVELAEALAPARARASAAQSMQKVPTPGKKTCEDVTALLGLALEKSVKAIALVHEEPAAAVGAAKKQFFLLLVRGDHDLNEVKAGKVAGLKPFRFASEAEIVEHLGCEAGYIGPVGADRGKVTVIADRSVAAMADFVCGANDAGFHLTGVNWGRDLPEPVLVADIRNVRPGDPSPDGKGELEICRGIEVGHVFYLGTVYSKPLNCAYLDETGRQQLMEMGCYGIGVTRIVGAAIEQGHDERGIILPDAIAPFALAICPIGWKKSAAVQAAAEKLYGELSAAGIDVLLDDRDERPGVMFAEMELIGISHRIVIGERGLKEGRLEYQGRRDPAATPVALAELAAFVKTRLCER
jgi:prolyl-tRNA synthetase